MLMSPFHCKMTSHFQTWLMWASAAHGVNESLSLVIRLSTVRSRSGPATFCRPRTQTSSPGPANSGPGPGPVLDLDPRSGPGLVWVRTRTPVLQCNYFLKQLFVINIHIYIIIQKFIFLICALPNSLRPIFQLIFRNYESVDLLTFILPSK